MQYQYALYDGYEQGLNNLRVIAIAYLSALSNPFAPFRYMPGAKNAEAFCKLCIDIKLSHSRSDFGISHTKVLGEDVRVKEEVVQAGVFCDLLHFKKEAEVSQPRMLVVAPLSGHFATLLRGTVETLLPDFDVYLTDWKNVRDIPLVKGRFDLDDEIELIQQYIRKLGPRTHVVAVCQPAVPVLCAISLLAGSEPEAQPASMTLIGGPIDARANPTAINRFAESRSLPDFMSYTCAVPTKYAGAGRLVYPGFMQIALFMLMNLSTHSSAFAEMFGKLVEGKDSENTKSREFYNEYLSVMDTSAEFYMQTVDTVFKRHLLAKNQYVSRGKLVNPSLIDRTRLLAIEGENDDICGPGQTAAALDLCENAPLKRHHLQPGVGHYGTFNGSKWRNEIYPVLKSFALQR